MTDQHVTTITFAFYSDDRPSDDDLGELTAAAEGAYEAMCDGTYDIGFVNSIEFDEPKLHGPVRHNAENTGITKESEQ